MQDLANVILRRSWAVWLLLLVPFAIGDWVLWHLYRSGALAHELVAQAVVPLAVIGSIGTLIFLLNDLLQRTRGDRLEFNSDGVIDLISKWRLGTIRWDEIVDVKILRNNAAKIDIKIAENSPLRRRIDSPGGIITIYSLAMTEQQERAIRRLQTHRG